MRKMEVKRKRINLGMLNLNPSLRHRHQAAVRRRLGVTHSIMDSPNPNYLHYLIFLQTTQWIYPYDARVASHESQ